MGFHAPFQEIFPTQGLNPSLLWLPHCKQTLAEPPGKTMPLLSIPLLSDRRVFKLTLRIQWPCPLVQQEAPLQTMQTACLFTH